MTTRPTTYDFNLAALVPPATGPGWLVALKERAAALHATLGVPTTAVETWKYTPLRDLGTKQFASATEAGAVSLPEAYPGSVRAVLVDGVFRSDLSTLPSVAGLTLAPLDFESDLVEKHLGALAQIDEHTFGALATAMLLDGVLVHVTGMVEPLVEVVYVSTGPSTAAAPRVLVIAERGSSAKLVETYVGTGGLTLPITEVFVAEDANIEHVRVQDEGEATHHIGLWQVRQEGSSEYRSYNICFGSKLGRVDQSIWLGGQHVTTRLDGVVVARGDQLLDNHTRLDHAFPNGNSFEIYKQVVDDRASVVFNGQIYVHQDAQKTDAKQTNQALLLSPDATINSKPQLEIFADDVKCTHGATVGAPETDSLFYLRSRGVPLAEAQALLVYAFAAEVLELITNKSVRERLEARLFTKLGH